MLKVTTPLVVLLAPFSGCFNEPVHSTFCLMVVAWVACLGRRTISRVWQTTGQAADTDHCYAYRLFNAAAWNWDDIARLLLVELLCDLIPGSSIWLVVDDTLCHKRGAKVAFGGIFLDAVLSSRKHKVFRFGVNWVTLGVVIQLPFRKDRPFCVNLLWRVYSKKVKGLPHQTKSQLARQMVDLVAAWLPERTVYVVADSAYIGRHLLKGLPGHVAAVGPINPKASLSSPLPAGYQGRRKKGQPLPRPIEMLNDPRYQTQELLLPLPNKDQKKELQVKVIKEVCWYPAAGQRQIQLVLVHDPEGKWRDELLLSMDVSLPAEAVILGYMRRWSVEVCYWESKELLGLHEPQVWTELAVQRAHPMAWFVGGLVLVWYARYGQDAEQAHWDRPWYEPRARPTFAQMLATLRLHLWRNAWAEATSDDDRNSMLDWLFHYISTAMG
jgi:DDE superfamily endonuclease